MATANHVLLRRITLTASASSVTFDSIPQTGYTDLKIVGSVRSDYSGQGIALRINPNGATTNMTAKVLLGSGSAASSFSDTIAYASADGNTSTSNTYNNVEWYISNYTSANSKPISVDFVTETNATAAIMGMSAGLWASSSAITSLDILTTVGNLMAGSSFSLYGIADVNTTPKLAPKADGGDIIKTDGTYWYHAFTGAGIFRPQLNLIADVLVIAGGGGGGTYGGGGGGAGGFLPSLNQALTSGTAYTVSIGAGGSGNASGSNSQFGSLTTVIGGGYGGYGGRAGASGGSGGGGADGFAGGSATSGQGNNGATGTGGYGGGGGGAGAAGTVSNGGVGSNAYSSWASATSTGVSGYYAGGGGGWNTGSGGAGGGTGAGSPSNSAPANTGSGAGGTNVGTTGNGGSGIVIIRYTVA